MANLIIKPSASGSLILQDEGGDAAITVGTTGQATFAENATLSGTANNVGTVTAGTYKGTVHSDATFPAGHIIQTTVPVSASDNYTNLVMNDTHQDTVVAASITTSNSANSVILHCSFVWYLNNTSGNGGLSFRWKKTHSGEAGEYPNSLNFYDGSGGAHTNWYSGHADNVGDFTDSEHFSLQDPECGYEGAVTYTLQTRPYNINSASIGSGNMNGRWMFWLQEVKR